MVKEASGTGPHEAGQSGKAGGGGLSTVHASHASHAARAATRAERANMRVQTNEERLIMEAKRGRRVAAPSTHAWSRHGSTRQTERATNRAAMRAGRANEERRADRRQACCAGWESRGCGQSRRRSFSSLPSRQRGRRVEAPRYGPRGADGFGLRRRPALSGGFLERRSLRR